MRNKIITDNLAGTSWTLATLNGRSVLKNTTVTLNFEDGWAAGSDGCNNYTASYKTEGKKISIGPAATTRKMCAEPPNVMEQEIQYLQALTTAATYRIDGWKLELRTAEGALAATCQSSE
jgi:heat shock protein HslJ